MKSHLSYFKDTRTLVCLLLVLFASYFTYMHNFAYPPNLFWDENYHVASAQKYLNGIHFMEPHPPLGKLLIAAGEGLLQRNEANDQFIGTDYGKKLPKGFSFAGYRLIPTFLAWMIAPMLFAIFLKLSRKPILSVLFSFLYIFDNALIVHHRAAMLESTLLFFVVAMILAWLYLLDSKLSKKQCIWWSVLFGAAFGAVMTTKVNGLIMILFVPPLLWKMYPNFERIGKFIIFSLLSFAFVYVGVWQTHFAIGKNIEPSLADNGFYKASEQYKGILANGTTGSIFNFPTMMRDSLAFLPHYQRGVPDLNLCKTNENGSPFFYWPLGGKAINYRWETPGNTSSYQYLYLQSNPVIWLGGLAAVIVAISLLLAHVFLPVEKKLRYPIELTVFAGVYVSYMLTMSQITRAMYLYHYFIPLVMSFLLFAICVLEIQQILRWKITDQARYFSMLGFCALIFAGYQFYRPLTYYEPITDEAFQKRSLLAVWDLECVRCPKSRYLHPKTCSE